MQSSAYLAASGLCIGAIACLAQQKTARLGECVCVRKCVCAHVCVRGVGGGAHLHARACTLLLHPATSRWPPKHNTYILRPRPATIPPHPHTPHTHPTLSQATRWA